MGASALVADLVADVEAAGFPATAEAAYIGTLLSADGLVVFVDLPILNTSPLSADQTRVELTARVLAPQADPRGPAPLIDATEALAVALGARGELRPEVFTLGDLQAASYPLTVFRKG